jgi:hypothetical protein
MRRLLRMSLHYLLGITIGAVLMFVAIVADFNRNLDRCEAQRGSECTYIMVPKAALVKPADRSRGV